MTDGQMRRMIEADGYFDAGDFERALAIYLGLKSDGIDELELMLSISAAYYSLNNWREALSAAKAGIALYPDEKRFYFNAGLACNMLSDDTAASEYFTSAIAADGEYATAYYARGNISFDESKYAEALEDYLPAMEKGLDIPEVLYNAGICFEKLFDMENAVGYYETYLAHSPGWEVLTRAGVCEYLRGGGELEHALELLEAAVARSPGNSEAAVYRAAVLAEMGRADDVRNQISLLNGEAE